MSGAGQATEWPTTGLGVASLISDGWRSVPFRQFVLKIHSRCNLACDYCYVYESADQSWQGQQKRMSKQTIRSAARRIAAHVEKHALREIEIVLHGGEPLLAGVELVDFAAREFFATAPAGCRVNISAQTNGVLLDRSFLDLFAEHGVGVSVSVDGDRAGHDRHRRFPSGKGSHEQVSRALALLTGPYRQLYRGLLCTVDLANDPIATYEALLETAPPRLNFLLPHGTWSAPPPGRPPYDNGTTPYADWLIEVFDRWYPDRPCGVRYFEEIMNLLLGGASRSESIGLSPVSLIVIETDGTLQQVDSLKTSFHGAPETGLNVADHDLEQALHHPGVVARQIGLSALSDTCLACPVRDICGGGSYVHRYRAGDGYRNPSVYCPDLQRLIGHIGQRLVHDARELAYPNN